MDGVDDVLSHNVFANLYYDFRSDSKFTPSLGIGVGFAKVSLAYRTLWHRTNDLENITVFDTEGLTGDELAKAQALNRKIAGTITTDSARLSDLLPGYQAVAGLDYQVSDPVTIGLKFRWASFGEFDDESAYDSLRDHASVAGNPPVPVTYYIKTDDIQFWAIQPQHAVSVLTGNFGVNPDISLPNDGAGNSNYEVAPVEVIPMVYINYRKAEH